jgi:hypothetical protein
VLEGDREANETKCLKSKKRGRFKNETDVNICIAMKNKGKLES